MKWVVDGFDRDTEQLVERIWLPSNISDAEVLDALGLSELPHGDSTVTEAIADLVRAATGREIDLVGREYWIGNTAESDWLQAEHERQSKANTDTRTERWVILGFDKAPERLTEYVEIPPGVSDRKIAEALGDPPDPKFRCWKANPAILALGRSATGRALDIADRDYYLEFQCDHPSRAERDD